MSRPYKRHQPAEVKRRILVADDEAINRIILGSVLEETYDVIYASNGLETLQQIRDNIDLLSLILLDLRMPGLTGLEILEHMRSTPDMQKIPVIVLTADQNAEVESLTLGAVDFIPKPYPLPKVILARVLRTIELFEDRQIIRSTERDPVTGLYHKEYFYRYAEQYDRYHPNTDMDAIVVDIHHFHIINDRFGMAYGDDILNKISEKLKEVVRGTGGIVCRREADTFMIYRPHRTDYKDILEHAAIEYADGNHTSKVRLMMGVYAMADKKVDIKQRFDRAKMAVDTIRGNITKNIGLYDDRLREKELFAERLIDDFRTSIDSNQFIVYYQPKFDIRSDLPILTSAEALVRWRHPELGMISPSTFIPLFEENGLIQELDMFVWQSAAAQIRYWKDTIGYSVPISVNVSRIDFYEPNMTSYLESTITAYDLTTNDLCLEITESAYTNDSRHIIDKITKLRSLGFRIEMDDFGVGYSSLSMVSTLPIDAIKLDMLFIRNAFKDGKDTKLLEIVIDIAGYLGVPVIAEGVETVDQLRTLRAIGCDIAQGYYFSIPITAEGFEPFLIRRKCQETSAVLGSCPGI